MRIAHIVSTYPPYYGGMGNSVFAMASELSKLGHEVEVFTPQSYEEKEIRPAEVTAAQEHAPEVQEQIDFARRLKPDLQYGNAARLPTIGRELDAFDLVHLHYPFFGTANLVRKWKRRNPKKPFVITYHMDTRAPGWKGLVFKYYSAYWMPKILQSANLLIASSFDYISGSDAGGLFAKNKEKWVELPFGVEIERFQPAPPSGELLARHNLNLDLPTILFVGGMDEAHYFKGIPVLLEAMALLKGHELALQAVFVGDGGLRPGFEEQARFYVVEDMVRFVGHVSEEELPSYYHLVDLLILPSINRGEAFGMVLLEAFASGVPVVATDLPGVRAVAADGGMIVPPNDARALAEVIAGYFDKKNDQESWRRTVRDVAEKKYAWGVIVGRLDEMYKKLVGE